MGSMAKEERGIMARRSGWLRVVVKVPAPACKPKPRCREAGLTVPLSPDYRQDRRSRLAALCPKGRGQQQTPGP